MFVGPRSILWDHWYPLFRTSHDYTWPGWIHYRLCSFVASPFLYHQAGSHLVPTGWTWRPGAPLPEWPKKDGGWLSCQRIQHQVQHQYSKASIEIVYNNPKSRLWLHWALNPDRLPHNNTLHQPGPVSPTGLHTHVVLHINFLASQQLLG